MNAPRGYMETIDHARPMAAARIVRRERYAQPGGYAIALVLADGETLCPDCVASCFHEISVDVRDPQRFAQWRPAGILCECETDGGVDCVQCNRAIWTAADGDA